MNGDMLPATRACRKLDKRDSSEPTTTTTTTTTQYKALLGSDKPEKEIEYVHTKTHRSTGIVYGATTIRQSYHLVEEEWYF